MDSSIPIPFLTWASLPPRQRPAPLPGPSGYKPTAKWMWVYLLFLPLLPLSNNLLFLPLSILSACFAFLFGLYCLCSLLSAHLDWWSHSKLPQNSEMGHGTSTPAWPASPARHPGEHTASQSLRSSFTKRIPHLCHVLRPATLSFCFSRPLSLYVD